MWLFRSLFGRKGDGGDGGSQAGDASELDLGVIAKLRKHGVTDRTQLKLEYFFYTDLEENAAALARRLGELGYEGGYDRPTGDDEQFLVTGWTVRMRMNDQTVLSWAARMRELGREHDCEFDGWGTHPQQA